MTNALRFEQPRARRAALVFLLSVALLAGLAPAAEAAGELVRVVVSGRDARHAELVVRSVGGVVDATLPVADAVGARVPSGRIDDIARRALVVADRRMTLTSASYGDALVSAYPRTVGATDLWGRGLTGRGVTVALVDTGVANVPDLAGRIVGVANVTRESSPFDTYGHGTFQAGLIAGNGASSSGRYVGVAPEAGLLSVKVAGATGETSLSQVLTGLQIVDASVARFNVRVALLALSSGSPLPPEIDPLSRALRTLWSRGVVVVVPAGNDGPDDETISAPGEDPVLLTAGSVNDQGTPEVGDDSVSDFSGRGPTRWGELKPDVAAPGQHLVSLRAPSSTIDAEHPQARVESAYFKGSGTSMASAVTAGAAALVLQARPDYSPDHVKAVLMATAAGVADGDVFSTGAGIVDAVGAVDVDPSELELPAAPDDAPPSFLPRGAGWELGDDGIWRFSGRTWNGRTWAGRTWNGRTWNDHEWNEIAVQARTWAQERWESRTWNEQAWEARTWAGRTWAARTWAGRTWNGRTWAGRTWAARTWAGRTWAGRTWSEDDWSARSWASRTWASRTWAGRTWAGRTWAGRTWSSRTWSEAEWDSRTWSGRTWSSRTWSSRTWSSRSWT